MEFGGTGNSKKNTRSFASEQKQTTDYTRQQKSVSKPNVASIQIRIGQIDSSFFVFFGFGFDLFEKILAGFVRYPLRIDAYNNRPEVQGESGKAVVHSTDKICRLNWDNSSPVFFLPLKQQHRKAFFLLRY